MTSKTTAMRKITESENEGTTMGPIFLLKQWNPRAYGTELYSNSSSIVPPRETQKPLWAICAIA